MCVGGGGGESVAPCAQPWIHLCYDRSGESWYSALLRLFLIPYVGLHEMIRSFFIFMILCRFCTIRSLDLIWALITFSTPWSRRSAVTELLDGIVPDVTSGLLVQV